MNRLWRGALRNTLFAALAMLMTACAAPESTRPDPEGYRETLKTLNHKRAIQPQVLSRDLHVFKVGDNLWVHRSYFDLGLQRLHANGMIMVGPDRITIIDAPWTATAAYDLLDWLDSTFASQSKRLVVTHAHDDRMGSIDIFTERMIPVYSQRSTAEQARKLGWTAPNFVFENSLPLRSGEQVVELYFPGAAHTADNIIAWFPEAKVLFGGCMVKSQHSGSLGFVGDADKRAWPQSLQNALARYPEAEQVVPGHGLPGDTDLVTHTLELLGH